MALVVMAFAGGWLGGGTVKTEHCVVSARAERDHNKLVSCKT